MKTLSLKEIFELINGEHKNPHEILGMHVEKQKGKKGNIVVVRAFLPGGQSITLLEQKNKKKRYEMKKIHVDGLFEVLLEDKDAWFPYLLEYTNHEGVSWESYDPYAFLPTISEYDRYLFGNGTHYELYEKMGARLIKHQLDVSQEATGKNAVSGVAFTVWAPNARTVSIIGSFNQWHTERHPMRLLGESGIWELFIPGLVEGDQYKFHITKADGNAVDKADPFAKFSEIRPFNASVIFGQKAFKWADKKWLNARKKMDHKKNPMNIYEVHLGSWKRTPENEFLSYDFFAEDLVAYVKEMGYTHIELLPVAEHPFDGSWGYQTSGYFAPTSRFGNPDEFRGLVNACHKENIGVILDWVPAHFPKDEFCLGRFDGTALYEHYDARLGEHQQWGTYIFNYGRSEVSNFLISNALYWFKEFHIDGLRVDAVASMLYLDFCKNEGEWLPNVYGGRENIEAVEFLKHLNSVIHDQDLGVLMIAEESTSWEGVTKSAKDDGLGFDFKWDMGWMNDFLSYVKTLPEHRKFHQNYITFAMAYHHSENYLMPISHDEVVHEKSSMVGKMPGDDWQRFANLRASYGYMMTHPGKKLLFMGSEFGQYQEWSEAKSLDWHLLEFDDHKETQSYVKDLNHMYLNYPEFFSEDSEEHGFQWIDCDNNEISVVSFIRRAGDEEVYVICNFTPQTHTGFSLGVPVAGEYTEIFNSDKEVYGGSGVINEGTLSTIETEYNGHPQHLEIAVPPLGIAVFKKQNN